MATIPTFATTVSVQPLGGTNQATRVITKGPSDRKVWLLCPVAGVFLSHQSIASSASGFALPANCVVQLDLPAGNELYAVSAAGILQLSMYLSPVMSTLGDALIVLFQSFLARFKE